VLTAALLAVALGAGVAGSWSPCGFSMIDTISAPRRRTGLSCTTFALGTCVGGTVTFTTLAAVGTAVRGTGLALVTAAVVVAAALLELRAGAVFPQVRRQVPEQWRRVLPLPLATGLYGVLLGLGFTTFVLTFAFWALVGLSLLLSTPAQGLAVGLAFGIGRALPVVLIAPIAHGSAGRRLVDAMAQQPRMLSTLRRAEAVGLLVIAVSVSVTDAGAATRLGAGTDPSVAAGVLVWTSPAGGVRQQEDGTGTTPVPPHSVVGGTMIAWRDGSVVHVARLADMTEVLVLDVPGVDALAISDDWLATRVRSGSTDTLSVQALATPTEVRTLATAGRPTQLGRPALEGSRLVYHVSSRTGSRIVEVDLATATSRVVRRSAAQLIANPSILGGELAYVRQTSLAQVVEVGPIGSPGRDRVVYRIGPPAKRDRGHQPGYSTHTRTPHPRPANWLLWTTALSATRAYVTLLPRTGAAQGAVLLGIPRS
jgi:hypothetical protein